MNTTPNKNNKPVTTFEQWASALKSYLVDDPERCVSDALFTATLRETFEAFLREREERNGN